MSNAEVHQASGTSDTRTDDGWQDPPTPGEWVLTKDEEESKHWWKAGSNRASASFTRLRVRKSGNRWFTSVTDFNAYGFSKGSTRLFKSRRDHDKREWALNKAVEYMQNHPGTRVFTGKPTLPEQIGEWELETADRNEWEWVAGEHSLRVEESGYTSRYKGGSWKFDVIYTGPDADETVVLTDARHAAAIECAVRCMEASEAAQIKPDPPVNSLQSVTGVGPAKALHFQLLGVTTPAELRHALNDDTLPHEIDAAFEKHVSSVIRSGLQ